MSIAVGSKDFIRPSHTAHLVAGLPTSTLRGFLGEGHMSYIVRSTKIADYLLSVLEP